MRPRSWLLATHIAHSTFFVFRIFIFIFNILIIHFSLRRQLAMVIFTRAFGCCGGETTFDSCSYSVRLCVRKSTHSFWWCVYLPHFTPFFLRRHLFHFIFSFISGTNYFSVFYDFFVRLWIVIIHTHTHIFHLRFVFFYRVDSSVFSLLISYCVILLLTMHWWIFCTDDDDCLSPHLKCTHLLVIITIIKE